MKHTFIRIYIVSAALSFSLTAASCGQVEDKSATPIPFIMETDIGNDIDDALAMDLLYRYAEEGKIDFLATCINKEGTAPAEYIDILNTWYGHPDIPIGIIHEGADCEADALNYAVAVSSMKDTEGNPLFVRTVNAADSLPEAPVLYRQILSKAEDNSVVIASVGFSTNLVRLLATGPDEWSDLNGYDLVKKKVRLLSVMAGCFDGCNPHEYNVWKDISSARIIFEQWPTEVVASPYEVGIAITYPAESIENDFTWADRHPVVEAYKVYQPMPYDRPTWDPTAVLYAVEGGDRFTVSPAGFIKVTDDGATVFTENPKGNRRYLSVTPEQAASIREYFVQTISKERN